MIIKDEGVLGEYKIKVGYKQFSSIDPDGQSTKFDNLGDAINDCVSKRLAQMDKEVTVAEYQDMLNTVMKNFSK